MLYFAVSCLLRDFFCWYSVECFLLLSVVVCCLVVRLFVVVCCCCGSFVVAWLFAFVVCVV